MRTDVPPGIKEPTDIVKAKGVVAGGLCAENSKDLLLLLPPSVAPAALAALRAAVLKLNEDKEHAEEAARTIGFVPEWIAGVDTNKEVRSAISISPEMRAFIADYIKRGVK